MRYSALRVIKEALTGHKGWTPAWRDVAPQAHYDYIVIGGGGHGLATAYYLARNHGAKRVAVLEKGGLAAAMSGATPRSSVPTISWTAMSRFTSIRSSSGRGWSRI